MLARRHLFLDFFRQEKEPIAREQLPQMRFVGEVRSSVASEVAGLEDARVVVDGFRWDVGVVIITCREPVHPEIAAARLQRVHRKRNHALDVFCGIVCHGCAINNQIKCPPHSGHFA